MNVEGIKFSFHPLGTLLSRMSVQLKPGQLISVQRTPSTTDLPIHCALNAPHHVSGRKNISSLTR